MTKQIPNLITLLNLLCGSIAVILAVQNHLVLAALFVAIGIFFDFFDGLAARLLNAKSELGLQLDSLADMVTSGLVPGIVMVQLLSNALVAKDGFYGSWDIENHIFEYPMLSFVGLAITLASCYRLANFNVDERQTDNFIGLPTPANALLVLSLPLILEYQPIDLLVELFTNMWFLFAFTVLSCFLLNANLELFALKFKNFKLDGNKTRFGFLILCVLLIVFLKFIAIPIIMLSYILISFFKKPSHA
jgi:CDP-diacylglycerol--serine O-phosphatidyltransferase